MTEQDLFELCENVLELALLGDEDDPSDEAMASASYEAITLANKLWPHVRPLVEHLDNWGKTLPRLPSRVELDLLWDLKDALCDHLWEVLRRRR